MYNSDLWLRLLNFIQWKWIHTGRSRRLPSISFGFWLTSGGGGIRPCAFYIFVIFPYEFVEMCAAFIDLPMSRLPLKQQRIRLSSRHVLFFPKNKMLDAGDPIIAECLRTLSVRSTHTHTPHCFALFVGSFIKRDYNLLYLYCQKNFRPFPIKEIRSKLRRLLEVRLSCWCVNCF